MNYKFSELVDIDKFQSIMEGLYLASGILSAIIDSDGNILVAVGWREICQKYHRVISETELLCKQSDGYIKNNLDINKPYICYNCANGLIDAAAPIIIEGKYLASVFHGQFLFEEPDVEKFRRQARKFGINEEEYIKALAKVPIYSKEKLDSIMSFFSQLAQMLAQMGLVKLRLMESNDKFQKVFHASPQILSILRKSDNKLIDINERFLKCTGFSRLDVIGKTPVELGVPEREWINITKALDESNAINNLEINFNFFEKVSGTLLLSAEPISLNGEECLLLLLTDITERTRMQEEMTRLERLNLIGQMAAGIAHEIRNPMTTVRGYLQLLGAKPQNEAQKPTFDLMISELDRANSIITEFLSFSRTKQTELQFQNLNDILNHLYPLLEADTFTQNKQIEYIPGHIPYLKLNDKEIYQLVLNLARNGLEAMKACGCLTIKTYLEDDKVVLAIEDEGCGISPKDLDKLGTPFFTTKENGTGLGLATSFKIAESHNAKIHIDSSPRGSKFFISFPITDGVQGQDRMTG